VEPGDLPLALDQAGAYIEETECGLAGYYQQYQRRRAEFLTKRGEFSRDYPHSVTTTWSLSFEKLTPLAVQVLRLCAFVAPDAIPEPLIEHALASDSFLVGQEQDLDQVISNQRTCSLIQQNPQERTLTIHQLVQVVLRDVMSEHELRIWSQRTIILLREVLPTVLFENWQACEEYLPHAQKCLSLAVSNTVEQARVMHWIGSYLLERQQTREVGEYLQKALHLRELHLGKEDAEIAASLDRLAHWWKLQGRFAEAEPLYLRALAIAEQHLGTEHPRTATSLNNLAELYKRQGRFAEAEPLFQRALAIREQHLDANHPDTATSGQCHLNKKRGSSSDRL
jgi:tetratricopeptide (TPR) repeat protein